MLYGKIFVKISIGNIFQLFRKDASNDSYENQHSFSYKKRKLQCRRDSRNIRPLPRLYRQTSIIILVDKHI